MSRLTNYFFNTLPDYFYLYDTYKDVNDEGILQRYMSVIQEDAEISDADITGLNELPFPLTTQEQYVNLIAGLYGYPPDPLSSMDPNADTVDSWYRNVLRNIVDINKVKGTQEGFTRFWGCMGATVVVTATQLTPVNYDDGSTYDAATPLLYDTECYPCSYLIVNVTGLTFPLGFFTDNFKRAIQSILLYLFPINAILDEFQDNGVARDIELGKSENLIKFKP